MNHVLPVSGHPVVIHVPVRRTVDCIFCEDLCADEKNIERPKCSTQFVVATERRVLIFFYLNGTISSQSIFELLNGTVIKEVIKNDPHG
jgi:hypothetical protein